MDGTTVDMQWADRTETGDLQWESFATVDAGGVLEAGLPTSAEYVGHPLAVRAVATDPMGREYIAYAPVSVDVQSNGGAPGDGGGSEDGSESDSGGTSSGGGEGFTGSTGGATTGGDDVPSEDGDDAGCSCSQHGPLPTAAWLWVLAVFVHRRTPAAGRP